MATGSPSETLHGATIVCVDAEGRPTQHHTADSAEAALRTLNDALRHSRWVVSFSSADGGRVEVPIDSIVSIRQAAP